MKNIKIIQYALFICLGISFSSCQKFDKPVLAADFPGDNDPRFPLYPGGPLKFYASFDGISADPLRNAVDSVRANFAAANPLTTIDGVTGKAIKGEDGKGVKYNSANDFATNLSSYSIAFWLKSGVPAGSRYETIFSLAQDSLYYNSAIHFDIYSGGYGSTASSAIGYYYMEQSTTTNSGYYFDKEFSGANSIPNLLDDQWHQLVFTYDETTSELKLYKDATLVTTVVWTDHGAFVPSHPINRPGSKPIGLAIGASSRQVDFTMDGVGDHDNWMTTWSGGIDQFRMYGNKVLTQAEIQTLFASKL